jgi:hypothetical protein
MLICSSTSSSAIQVILGVVAVVRVWCWGLVLCLYFLFLEWGGGVILDSGRCFLRVLVHNHR